MLASYLAVRCDVSLGCSALWPSNTGHACVWGVRNECAWVLPHLCVCVFVYLCKSMPVYVWQHRLAAQHCCVSGVFSPCGTSCLNPLLASHQAGTDIMIGVIIMAWLCYALYTRYAMPMLYAWGAYLTVISKVRMTQWSEQNDNLPCKC